MRSTYVLALNYFNLHITLSYFNLHPFKNSERKLKAFLLNIALHVVLNAII